MFFYDHLSFAIFSNNNNNNNNNKSTILIFNTNAINYDNKLAVIKTPPVQ